MPITAMDRLGDEDDIVYVAEIALESGTSIVPTHKGDIRYNTSLDCFQALDGIGVFNPRFGTPEDVLMHVKYVNGVIAEFHELGQMNSTQIEKLV